MIQNPAQERKSAEKEGRRERKEVEEEEEATLVEDYHKHSTRSCMHVSALLANTRVNPVFQLLFRLPRLHGTPSTLPYFSSLATSFVPFPSRPRGSSWWVLVPVHRRIGKKKARCIAVAWLSCSPDLLFPVPPFQQRDHAFAQIWHSPVYCSWNSRSVSTTVSNFSKFDRVKSILSIYLFQSWKREWE